MSVGAILLKIETKSSFTVHAMHVEPRFSFRSVYTSQDHITQSATGGD